MKKLFYLSVVILSFFLIVKFNDGSLQHKDRGLLSEAMWDIPLLDASKMFQPQKDQIAKFEAYIRTTTDDKRTQIVKGIPYSWYVATDKSIRIIHPGVIGRTIYHLGEVGFRESLDNLVDLAVELPNGGLAYYYPKYIRIARILGENYIYSAMTTADTLAGYVNLSKRVGFQDLPELNKTYMALKFPWKDGGVLLDGKALLEVPLSKSPPEIVLNGWLHALLYVNDYNLLVNEEAESLVVLNLHFLSEILPKFDVPALGLSRYSDLSPYKVFISYSGEIEPELRVIYKSDTFNDIAIELKEDKFAKSHSIYENQIFKKSENKLVASISCSQHFKTVILGKSEGFDVKIWNGLYDYKSTVPGNSRGESFILESKKIADGLHGVTIDAKELNLICGYPTNFRKNKNKNYYHVQHVVALYYLSQVVNIEDSVKCTMINWGKTWESYMHTTIPPQGMQFQSPQKVLDGINAGKPIHQFKNYTSLQQSAYKFFDAHCN